MDPSFPPRITLLAVGPQIPPQQWPQCPKQQQRSSFFTAPSIRWPMGGSRTPRYPLMGSVPNEKSMTRLGLRFHFSHRDSVAGGGHRYRREKSNLHHIHGVLSRTLEQRGNLLSGVVTHLLDLSFFPTFHRLYYLFFFQPKGKERKGNLSTTIACQAPIIFKPSSPLPFNSPYLAENFPSLKLSLISGSSSFLSLLFSKLNGT